MPERKPLAKLVKSQLHVILAGQGGLVMDHPRGADPDDPTTIRIKELAAKGSKMTPEDRELKEALQWRHSLYLDDAGRLVFPTRSLWIALAEAAKGISKGTAIIDRGGVLVYPYPRGIAGPNMLIGYQGPDGTDWTGRELSPDDLQALYKDSRYRLRVALNGNPSGGKRKSMIMRTRPVFEPWSLEATMDVTHSEVGLDEFAHILSVAGNQGIGNARRIAMGRFTAEFDEEGR